MARTQRDDAEGGARPSRISLPLTPDGTAVDWENTRPSVAAKFESILKTDSRIRDAYNEETGENSQLFEGITEANISECLDLVTQANGLVMKMFCGKFMKHPALKDKDNRPIPFIINDNLLAEMFVLTPEQHKELDPRATRLAQKKTQNLPPWVKENLDLILLVGMFLSYNARNAKSVMMAQVAADIKAVQHGFASRKAEEMRRQPQPDKDVIPPANGVDHNPPPEFVAPPQNPEAPTV